MPKRAYPNYDTYYTFKYDKNGKETDQTLLFKGELPNGRLSFLNVNYKTYTNMSKERFSYLHRFNLKSERAKAVQQVIPLAEIDKKAKWLKAVNVVESLPKEKYRQFELISSYEPKRFVTLLKLAIKELDTESYSLEHIFRTYNDVLAPWFKFENVL